MPVPYDYTLVHGKGRTELRSTLSIRVPRIRHDAYKLELIWHVRLQSAFASELSALLNYMREVEIIGHSSLVTGTDSPSILIPLVIIITEKLLIRSSLQKASESFLYLAMLPSIKDSDSLQAVIERYRDSMHILDPSPTTSFSRKARISWPPSLHHSVARDSVGEAFVNPRQFL
ncbi:uncharacterized protein RCC_08760 [Ramularia collo-cygni]|uniref:Uncharacterized protein n=1 Tax=Ramularia collo-cygni TaxID=112498 RepID=A0A2D3V813_9PEZI|nr:uncharacterized protein RCC_08760 [Ramularia collo-cygni]CZT23050.1 uncharacterized protein RCC_08760 [Ramularia collo-cygni]